MNSQSLADRCAPCYFLSRGYDPVTSGESYHGSPGCACQAGSLIDRARLTVYFVSDKDAIFIEPFLIRHKNDTTTINVMVLPQVGWVILSVNVCPPTWPVLVIVNETAPHSPPLCVAVNTKS
jgi:hypothetical protein